MELLERIRLLARDLLSSTLRLTVQVLSPKWHRKADSIGVPLQDAPLRLHLATARCFSDRQGHRPNPDILFDLTTHRMEVVGMLKASLYDTLILYCIIYALASLLMDELLVCVIGAPNNAFTGLIALLSGISVPATLVGVLYAADENDAPML